MLNSPSLSSAKGANRGDSPRGALTAVFICMVALVLIAAGIAVWDARASRIKDYQDRDARLALILADQASRTLQAVDLVVQASIESLNASGLVRPEGLDRSIASEIVHRALQGKLANLPQLEALTVVDPTGRILNTTRFWPMQAVVLTRSDFIDHFRNAPEDQAYVSKPIKSILSGNLTVLLTRRIVGPNGRLAGFVSGAVSLKFFQDFFRTIDPDETQILTLLRRDGTVLALHPMMATLVGNPLPPDSPWYRAVAGGGGSYAAGGAVTGLKRYTVVHPLTDYPLVIDVGVMERVALAEWQRQTILIGLAAALVIGILIGLFHLLRRQFHDLSHTARDLHATAGALRTSEAALSEKSAALEATLRYMDQGLIMMTPDLRVAVWNP
jgi:hypothetical protein